MSKAPFKRILLSLTLAMILALCAILPASAALPTPVDLSGALVILHTNDIHGHAMPEPENGILGYAAIAQVKKDLEAAGASVLLLDAGDGSQGTPLVNLSYGRVTIDFMNAAGYDAMAPGNHEFDWGSDNFLQNAEAAEFPILAANILDRVSGAPLFQERTIFTLPNGVKVGVFGLDTPETMTKTHPDKVRNIRFLMDQELYDCAQAQVDALKAEGADLIVLLGHLGVDDESIPNRSTDIIEKVTGIDLVIDGHSHTEFPDGQLVGDTLLVSTGEWGKALGVVLYDGEKLSAGLYHNADAEVASLITTVNAEVSAQLSAVFAQTEVDLNGERDPGVRTEETNLGDFAADSILWAAKDSYGEDVVAAVTNGGGIRTSIKVGDISMNDMKTVFPFGNEVAVLTVTGAELLEALEAATFTTPVALGAFPQVAGITFTIDTSVPYEQGEAYENSTYFAPAKPGSRVTIETVGGEPFDLEALYTIATNDFTAAGGDTYYAFRFAYQTSGWKTGIVLEDALVRYVQEALGGVVGESYAQPAGRITIK
jgi:2',3'-cyclic-nucleotide 2'-phosphodiesterase (5'-nucleotidase family)